MSISISGNGSITGATTSYSFDQSVSIGGTLTYEDVSNIDSVGLITARSGIHVTGVGSSVGIGTDNPGASLQITADSPGILFQDANSGATESKIEGLSGHLYYTTDNLNRDHIFSATDESEALRITGDGNVQIANGNLVFSTSGTGIDFSATSDATGSTSELLDDYEEGEFTITLDNNVTIHTQTQATYVKIGRIVHVTGQFRINSDNSNSALVMNNLPFVSLNTGNNDGGFSPGAIRLYQYPDPGGYGNYISLVQKNDTNLYFYYSRDSNTDGQILAYSNGYVAFSCTYHTAA